MMSAHMAGSPISPHITLTFAEMIDVGIGLQFERGRCRKAVEKHLP